MYDSLENEQFVLVEMQFEDKGLNGSYCTKGDIIYLLKTDLLMSS